MIALLCALAGGEMFFLSNGTGDIWPLALLAPMPVLWLAFGPTPTWQAAAASLAAFAFGQSNLILAYGGALPAPALVVAVVVPALLFALAVLFARRVARRMPAAIAVFAFPIAFTAIEFITFAVSPDGTAGSIAYTLVGAPLLIQSASVFGLWSVTFFVMFVPAALALATREQQARAAILAILAIVVVANVGFGLQRGAPASPTVRVGLATNDALLDAVFANDERTALAAVRDYEAVARKLSAQGARIIVLPEKLAVLDPPWRAAALGLLATAAHETNAAIVAGFDWREADGSRRNAAVLLRPDGTTATYFKQHLVQGLEAPFAPGRARVFTEANLAIAICKDMDFPATIIDAAHANPALMLVPAWDFRRDDFAHARMAILRGVEGGFAVARAANQGLMTVSDATGRILASRPSSRAGFQTLIADVPIKAAKTLYARVGDLFAWICTALLVLLLLMAGGAAPLSRDN